MQPYPCRLLDIKQLTPIRFTQIVFAGLPSAILARPLAILSPLPR